MKQLLLVTSFVLSLFVSGVFGQTIVQNGFEQTAADTWSASFSTVPCTNGADRWDYSATLGGINPAAGSQFWGITDLNGNCGGAGFETITFANTNISGYTSVQISFEYNTVGLDDGDDIQYEVFHDNVSQGVVLLVDGTANFTTGGWITETINVPGSVTNVRFELSAKQNGGDYIGFDNIILTGTVASTDTESEFTSAAGTVAENAGTTNLPLTITNPAPGATTTTTIELTSGNAAMLSNFAAVGSTVTETTVAGGATDNYVLNIMDNGSCDGAEIFVFTITNVSGGQGTPAIGTQSTYTLTISDDEQTNGAIRTLSFEGADNWGFTGNGATSSTLNKFFGTTSYELSGSDNLTTDNFSIAGMTNVTVQVAFASVGADGGEDLFLDLSYDNGATWTGTGSTKLVDGFSNANINMGNTNVSNPTTVATNPWIVAIAPSETQVRVRLRSVGLDGGENYFVDDIILSADFCGCTAPTVQPSNITFGAVTATSIPVSWTNSGDGNSQIVLVSEGSAVNADPTNNINYTADNDWTGTPDEIGTGNFVVYTGNAGPVTVNNLDPNTTYHFAIYEYNTVDDCYYLTSPLTGNITTLCDDPTTQPSAVNFASVTSTGMTINWTGGNGTNSIVVVHEGAAVDSDPVDGVSYTADTDFSGTPDEIGTGNFVVYTGTLNTVAITGLDPETTYHVAVYEFNSASGCYNTVGEATNNQLTPCPSPPDNVGGFAVTAGNESASITWTNPTFCFDELLIVAEDGNIGFSPSGDGTAYTANSVYGSGTCVNCTGANNEYAVYKGTGTSTTITGLTNGVSYCFKVWTRNGTDWSLQDVVCSIIPNAAIPDDGCATSNYLTSTFTYAGTGQIADIDVSVFIEHTFRGDLVIDLISPTGTIVTILSSQGGTANNLEAIFDDASANTVYGTTHTLDATIDETFQPNGGTLSTFNTENPNGVWTLRICDDAGADTGGLINWFPTIIETCTATHTVTGFTPTTGPELTVVTVTGTGFTNSSTASIGGIAANTTFISATTLQVEVPVGATTNAITITESGCPLSTAGSFTLIENLGGCTGATAFTDLIISEVYDSDAANVWYIELFNPTGAAIDLGVENYTIDRYADAWFSGVSRTITLTGVVPAGSTFLVNIGSSANTCAGTWDFTESGGGINESDGIMLQKNGVDVDAVECPNQTGYSILRDPTAVGPTSTYAAADWTTDLTEDCSDIGSFVLPTPPPTVNTDPVDVFACAQAMNTAASAGNGGTLTYQWLYNDGSAAGWTNVTAGAFPTLTVAGETSVNLSITGAPADIATIDNYQFYCEVTEDGTCSAPSKAAQFYARTTDDPQLITTMINSCNTCGTEGENEYAIISIGDANVDVNPANIILNYGTTSPASNTFTSSFSAEVALVSALNAENAANGCGAPVFVDAVTTGTLPANSKVIIMDPNICTTVYDFSHFCGSGPVYLLFTTDGSWGSLGNFANSGGVRYFSLSITDVNGQTVYSEYSYDADLLSQGTDGDFTQFSFCEGPATEYRNDGCLIKTETLPAELIEFNAVRKDKVVDLNWATATEINVDQHVIQRSSNGEDFYDILSLTAAGNSSVNTYYTDLDYSPLDGVSYYRLKTIDFDDTFKLSPARIVNFESNDPVVLYGHNEWVISYKTEQPFQYELYNVLGELLNNANVSESGSTQTSIDHNSLPSGVYFINVTSGDYKKSIKVIK